MGGNQTGSGSLTGVRGVARWTMGGPDAGEATGLGFDHRLEVVAAPRALLLEVCADGCKIFFGEGVLQDLAIGCPSRLGRSCKSRIGRMRAKQGIQLLAAVGRCT